MGSSNFVRAMLRVSHRTFRLLLASLAVFFAVGCDLKEGGPTIKSSNDSFEASTEESLSQGTSSAPNFILLIADDMGVETLASYKEGSTVATTPNLDRLAAGGVQFRNFWVQPTCSPTRSTLLTGRYGFRTGVLKPAYPRRDLIAIDMPTRASPNKELIFSPRGHVPPGTKSKPPKSLDLSAKPEDGLPPSEVTLPKILKSLPENYATAAVGKWHLADSRNGWLRAPNVAGFDYYSGLLLGVTDSYFDWLHVEQGQARAENGYLDEHMIDDGISWVGEQAVGERPWFLWVAFTNPHSPITLPPRHLLKSEAALDLSFDGLTPDNTQPYAMAMIEAMDTLIGKLLRGIPESERQNTYVIFLGDNGSVKWAQPAAPVDPDRAKMTVYEGGIRTPLIVAGPGIPKGQTTTALANSVDLFATILDLVPGQRDQVVADGVQMDSVSLATELKRPTGVGPRSWIYADTESMRTGDINYAIRNRDYKLVVNGEKKELYKMSSDPWERNDLMSGELEEAEVSALNSLSGIVADIWRSESQF